MGPSAVLLASVLLGAGLPAQAQTATVGEGPPASPHAGEATRWAAVAATVEERPVYAPVATATPDSLLPERLQSEVPAAASGQPASEAEGGEPPSKRTTPLAQGRCLWAQIQADLATGNGLAWLAIPIVIVLIVVIIVWRSRRGQAKAQQTLVSRVQQSAAPDLPPTDRTQGLSSLEPQQRLAQFGANAMEDRLVKCPAGI